MVTYELGFEEWVDGVTQCERGWRRLPGQDNSICRHGGKKACPA